MRLCFAGIVSEGVQNEPLQNVSLWHVDTFKLKALKTQQSLEKMFTYPLIT